MYHVAYCFDVNYQQHFAAAISSLVKNFSGDRSDLCVHIITDVVSDTLSAFIDTFSKDTGISIKIHLLDKIGRDYLDKIPDKFLNAKGYLNVAAYFRIMIPIMLDADIDKVLYLDSDTIVNSDILEVLETDLDGMALAAVLDVDNEKMSETHGLDKYYNSGVMLINLALWRERGLTSACFEYIYDEKNQSLMADQCVINIILHKKIKDLPYKWNRFVSNTGFSHTQSDEVMRDAGIIHFITHVKPWHEWYENKTGNLYWQSLLDSKWPNPTKIAPRIFNEYYNMALKLKNEGKLSEAIDLYDILLRHLLKKQNKD
jgi:lipopolysaccharide biosynthesis glycosyltransferase